MKLLPSPPPGLASRFFALALLCALALVPLACGRDGEEARQPEVIVQTTVEPILADLPPVSDQVAKGQLPPLGSPMPAPWAEAPALKPNAIVAPSIPGIAAVVIDEASGAILYDKNAHMEAAPASLTKIATLILALEDGRLDEMVTTDVDSTAMRGSTVMGLLPGDVFSLRDLLYGLMLPSGNDAALAIGRFVAGSDPAFVTKLNALVRRLGLTDTRFANPHGLGGATHYTTAYDLAVLSRYGMSLPGFKEIVMARNRLAQGSRVIALGNINSFLNQYPGADGLKTGYTRRAGPTLAASATRNGHRLYAIVLNSQSREDDARRLLDWAFTSYTWPQ